MKLICSSCGEQIKIPDTIVEHWKKHEEVLRKLGAEDV